MLSAPGALTRVCCRHHTGLLPDRPGLHAPIACTVELPSLLWPPTAACSRLPYYLAVGSRVRRAVRRGQPLRCGDVQLPEDSVLLRLRQAQDARFFEGA